MSGPGERPDRRAVENALERAGLRILDRDLCLSETCTVDLVLADAVGRPVLALCAAGGAGELAAALEALAFARRAGERLAEHLDLDPARAGAARVLLVCGRASRELVERAELLAAAGLELREATLLKSARATRAYLARPSLETAAVPAGARLDGRPAAAPELAPERNGLPAGGTGRADALAGMDALVPPARELARAFAERVRRLDDRLVQDGLRWSLPEGELCALSCGAGGGLEGLLADGSPAMEIGGAADLEAFLERVLERCLELTDESARPVHLEPRSTGRVFLLTPEEIEAFRTPV